MQTEIIQYIGLNKLEDVEQSLVKNLVDGYKPKIERLVKGLTEIIINIKMLHKISKEHHYAIKIIINAPTTKYGTSAEDYDLAKAIHMAFEAMEHEIRHKLKI